MSVEIANTYCCAVVTVQMLEFTDRLIISLPVSNYILCTFDTTLFKPGVYKSQAPGQPDYRIFSGAKY